PGRSSIAGASASCATGPMDCFRDPLGRTHWPRQAVPALAHAVLAYALLWPARIAAQLRPARWGVSGSGVS
ncbi:MAG TPA: hypothetical protein VEP50_19300, partial [bacterium]|nr:hypothetical protein [bacterium]